MYKQGKRCKVCEKIKVIFINAEVCENCQRAIKDINAFSKTVERVMKKLIVILICLFLSHAGCGKYIGPDWGGISNCYAMDRQTQMWIDELNKATARNNRIAYQLDTTGHLFGGMFKLGIAYWGFSQKNAYGNVTGSLFALGGIIQIVTIRW